MKILLALWLSLSSAYATVETAFDSIYRTGEWGVDSEGHGTSGTGSDPTLAKDYLHFLQNFIQDHHIQSIVDVGCGDWALFSQISLNGIQYLGFDVVGSLIDHHKANYGKQNIRFIHGDASQMSLPKADLLIVKEVLQHLPQKNVHHIIEQVPQYKYALLINDVDPITKKGDNLDILPGRYTTVSLNEPPYHLKGKAIFHYSISGSDSTHYKEVFLVDNN